jgi:Flp pilus assembly CpaE family ATPase
VRQGHVGPFLKAKPDNGINTLASLQEDQLRERLPALLVDHGKNLDLLLTRPNPDGRFATPTPQQTAIIVNALTRSRECVIVDLGHEINSITRAVLDGADHVIVCLRPERVALAAARVMLGQLKDMLYEHTTLRTMVIGIVGGMSLPRNAIERFLGYPLLATIPARPSEVMQALNKGVPYLQLYPDSPISKFYRLLAKRLVVS